VFGSTVFVRVELKKSESSLMVLILVALSSEQNGRLSEAQNNQINSLVQCKYQG